jgi:uncharacterized phage infection (PIP) family protein YhgE
MKMNEVIAKLYDQALVLEGNSDYSSGELDIVKFADLIAAQYQGEIDRLKSLINELEIDLEEANDGYWP